MMVSFIPKFCELNLEDAKAQAITSEKFETQKRVDEWKQHHSGPQRSHIILEESACELLFQRGKLWEQLLKADYDIKQK